MQIKKNIFLSEDEVMEALQEYLSRRNIVYEIEELYVYADEEELLAGIEIIAE